ncbi:solute carrier family 15 member 2 [Esox lucius]|uniref:Solute carrier family 15 member 2 n=1 Tax=Esox lucius TaxID=8010 RepID=A0A6Q2YL66_ESOLU|nr:solute carrier family 15 member 2 [Esox lucius]
MGKRKEHELDIHENGKSKSPKLCGTNYPVSISFIVVNEFCERFSYYGMKAVLTLYFINYLHWDQNLSTAVYHAFSSLCYFTPVLGALIADSWLGKFRTIIYLSVVYVLGHIIKSVGAIPSVGNSTVHIALSMLGLVLIAFGTGGIKPCVAAFGGDQFDEEHTIERRKFFSIFYMSINAGSVLSTVITPILRGDVKCFGGDCYALAFGVPAILMVIALVVFISGSGMYKKSPPEGNVLSDVCKCIGLAIKNRWRSSEFDSKKKHWLDWAEEKYPRRLIHEIKMVLRVLVLYIPLPMFWALFDQQGSRWTLQATRMNMAFGSTFVLKPDQMQMLNALLILLFVPIFDVVVYPLIGLCRINLTPLKKMAVGMILAALAFGAATLVEVNVMKTVVEPAPRGQCLLQVYNLAESDIQLDISGSNLFSQPIKSYEDPPSYQHLQLGGSSKNVSMRIIQNKNTSECVQSFREQKAYSLILHSSGSGVVCQLASDNIIKSKKMEAHLRFINTLSEAMNITVGDVDFYVAGDYGISPNKSVIRNKYTKVRCSSGSQVSFINLGLLDFGASYTIILTNGSVGIVPKKMVDVVANNIHITWQIPQYILITAGEVMFSITGLEFSYSQAPANMKSVLQAGWLLTVAFGNVIVLIVAEGAGLNQWMEFLLFAGLLVAVCIIFSIMAYFYKYVDPEELDKLFQDKTVDGEDDDSLKKDKKEHMEQAGDSTYLKSGIKNTAM